MFSFKSIKLPIGINGNNLVKIIVACLLVPNIILFVICSYLGINRPLINIDYLIPITLIPVFRFRFSGLLLFLLFLIVFSTDILLISLQIFPFIKLLDLLYLSNFIFLGPVTYRVYLTFFIILLLLEFLVITKIVKNINIQYFLFIILVIFFIQLTQIFYTYFFNKKNFYSISNSSIFFLIKNHDSNFFKLKNLQPLQPIKHQNASKVWFDKLANNKPLNDKLLLIINESWGTPNDEKIQDATLAKLKSNMTVFDYFEQGSFPTTGATVAGELRELCELEPQLLDMSNVNAGFENCLPNLLKTQNYYSVSLHGTETIKLYNRDHWYPLVGFNTLLFGEKLDLPIEADASFGAVADVDLEPIVVKMFKNHEKLFFYWLTISTHTPYPKSSIRNNRFNCEIFNLKDNTEVCNNLKLQTQFFDALTDLIQRPEMQGLEVIVVGDHPPPILNFNDGIRTFNISNVSWVHFKIKEKK